MNGFKLGRRVLVAMFFAAASLLLYHEPAQAELDRVGLNLGAQFAYSADKQIQLGVPVSYNATSQFGDAALHLMYNIVSENKTTFAFGIGPVRYFGDGADQMIPGEHWSYDFKLALSHRLMRSAGGQTALYVNTNVRHDLNLNHDQPIGSLSPRSLTRVEARLQFAFLPKPPAPGANYDAASWERVGFGLSMGAQATNQQAVIGTVIDR